jgi:hypothetical protein
MLHSRWPPPPALAGPLTGPPATQAAFAATAVSTVSTALAERSRLAAHALLALAYAGWIHPVAVHWVWSSQGWLSARRDYGGPLLGANGLIDLAGSGCVHLVAGVSALVAAAAVGPRPNQFAHGGGVRSAAGSSAVLMAAGVLMRWWVRSSVAQPLAGKRLFGKRPRPPACAEACCLHRAVFELSCHSPPGLPFTG